MTLLFLPVTSAQLADWQAAGMLAGPLKAYAATPGLVAAFEASDAEEAEHLALLVASVAALAASGVRQVAVLEGAAEPMADADVDFGAVVTGDLRFDAVQSLFADEPDAPGLAEAAGAARGLSLQDAWNHPAVTVLLEEGDLLWHGAGEWQSLGKG
ncbi:MAG TPA: hypothetical protein VGK18_16745 [Propionicimonas sp.]|jgi:hypothetical protein|uniref:DUF6912 family protein n=1 Tax=Propionicimonas sp. TaxID=1955623 RepID=UPI002F4118D3